MRTAELARSGDRDAENRLSAGGDNGPPLEGARCVPRRVRRHVLPCAVAVPLRVLLGEQELALVALMGPAGCG